MVNFYRLHARPKWSTFESLTVETALAYFDTEAYFDKEACSISQCSTVLNGRVSAVNGALDGSTYPG
jgi:hypothetical protein